MRHKPYDPEKNYCGPEGHFSFPRRFYDMDFNYYFYEHDCNYAEGGGPRKRRAADRQMYDSMLFKIRAKYSKWHPKRYLAWRRARKYYLTCRATGSLFFGKKGNP